MKRTDKIALIQSILAGNATPRQISDLRKSREPIYVTLLIDEAMAHIVDDPQYCITRYKDGTIRCYDRYADGREVDRV